MRTPEGARPARERAGADATEGEAGAAPTEGVPLVGVEAPPPERARPRRQPDGWACESSGGGGSIRDKAPPSPEVEDSDSTPATMALGSAKTSAHKKRL